MRIDAMAYPGNYGFVPHTLSEDGDPIDVLVCNTRQLVPGCVINVRPIADRRGPNEARRLISEAVDRAGS